MSLVINIDRNATDVEFLQSLRFGDEARAKLVKAAGEGDPLEFVARLRKRLPDLDAGSYLWPSRWSRAAFEETSRQRELFDVVAGLDRKRKSKAKAKAVTVADGRLAATKGRPSELYRWLQDAASTGPLGPVERLALVDLLLERGSELPDLELWATFRAVVEAEREGRVAEEEAALDGDRRFVAEAEWAFVLARTLPWLAEAAEWEYAAQLVFERQLLDNTETDGTPAAEMLRRLEFWLASFARIGRVANATGGIDLSEEAADRLRDLVSFGAGCLRADGRAPFATESATFGEVLRAAVEAVGLPKRSPERVLVEKIAGGGSDGTARRKRVTDDWPSTQSDWAAVAHLKSGWEPDADSLVVDHAGADVRIDLAILGHPLVTGTWGLDVRLDGEPVRFTEGWECVCWFADDEVDYVELQYDVEEGLRIERQLLLPRGDRFAVLLDNVAAGDGVRIEYESRLPLAEGREIRADVDTRECTIHTSLPAARAFPVGLPQDRVLSGNGSFAPEGRELRLQHNGINRLHAPLVLDWGPERIRSQADWRVLTVTEAGEILRPHLASGHRLRVGRHQLMTYRSLEKGQTARAVLGLHTPAESVIGRVEDSGEIDMLLLVN